MRDFIKKILKKELMEIIELPVEIGDTVLMGKFKNKKVVVKDIEWDEEKGDLKINGKPALKMRITKKLNEIYFLGHSTNRIKERLKVFTEIDFPIGVIREVNKNLSILDGYDFPKDKSYGIMLGNFNPNPKSEYFIEVAKGRGYYRLQDDKIIHDSTGDQFWIIVRNNEATTFMLRKAIQTQDPEHNKDKLRVDDVIKNLESFINKKQQVSTPNLTRFKKIGLTNGKKVRYYQEANKFETLEGEEINVDSIFDLLSPKMQDLVFNNIGA